VFHNRIVLSSLPLASVFPSGENAKVLTSWLWSVNLLTERPEDISHNVIALLVALARMLPSGEDTITEKYLECPVSKARGCQLKNIIYPNAYIAGYGKPTAILGKHATASFVPSADSEFRPFG
jgi:hypothetical protein